MISVDKEIFETQNTAYTGLCFAITWKGGDINA